jgi:hypothetical protein
MTKPVRLFILLVLLSLVLLYAWVTDGPTPAAPRGEFGGILLFTILVVCLALMTVLLLRVAFSRIRRSRKE